MLCRIILMFLLFFKSSDHQIARSSDQSAMGEWELKKESDNILVYTRKSDDFAFKELKCVTTVKASLSSIVKMLIDVDHYTEWIFHCEKASMIKKISDAEIYSYQLIWAPWPVADRDMACHLKVIQNSTSKIVTVTSEASNGLVPEVKDVVRVKKFRSVYTLTPLANGNVQIVYELGTDPGGNIPAWLVNSVMVKGPLTSQEMMNKMLQSPQYKSAKLDYIIEVTR